ncbi:LysE type translocator [Pseudomonas duriflava]|uniref:LysE type translocator n=1 Tax=Pseudomonas duriflava TaxID=459528 RepID=A0A562Q775_9PSED|nr:LysE type translocator [Pseudomonas duriflava]
MLSFILFAFVASITPGPTNILVLSNSSRYGWGAAVLIILGDCTGAAAIVVTVGLGVGESLLRYPLLQRAMAGVGVLWLTYLAWQLFSSPAAGIEVDGRPKHRALPGS